MVNHVIYFGDGISRKTVLRGFEITGANNFVTDKTSGFEADFHSLQTMDAIRVVGLRPPFLKRLVLEGSKDADIVLVGHTHIPFRIELDGVQVVNPLEMSRSGSQSRTCA